ncbi:MAG: outer membrane beta-barrel protein [Acidobacteriaceae bacterium]|nr:outer membrane beta-barrel protein [Acidobacteriaceae bacterium]
MRKRCLSLSFSISAFLGLAQLTYAQSEFHHLTFNVGGGYTATTGNISNRLDGGGHFQAGIGYNLNRYLGILGTFNFHQLGLTGQALNEVNVPDGSSRVYSLTAEPKITLPYRRLAGFYLLGGGGWMRRTVEFTQPTVAQTIVFDPWFGYYGPALIPANQVIGSYSQNAGVWDVGGGFNIPLPRARFKLYIESRFYDGITNTHTTLVPITVGLRW